MDSRIIYVYPNYNKYKDQFKYDRIWRTDGKYEPFVYIIQEVETENMYIGSRTKYSGKPCLESDLGSIYFTSSTRFDWKSNPSSFEICKIISCASNHDALILEGKLIEQNGAIWDDDFYNKAQYNLGFNNSNKKVSDKQKKKLSLAGKGIKKAPHSKETRDKISKSRKGLKRSKEECDFLSRRNKELYKNKENHPFYGKSHSKESKMKMSESNKGRQQPLRKCPYCGKEGRTGAMTRFHFENCKRNPNRLIEYIECPKCNKKLDKRNLPNTKRHHFDNCIFI